MYVASINNVDCPNLFSFDGNPSTSKFLTNVILMLIISIKYSIQGEPNHITKILNTNSKLVSSIKLTL